MIEILHYEKVNKNKTIGYVDVKIPILKPTVLILRKIAHVQSGDRRWFGLPCFPREINNETEYLKYFQFEEDSYNVKFLNSLPLKVDDFCTKHKLFQDELPSFPVEEEIPF